MGKAKLIFFLGILIITSCDSMLFNMILSKKAEEVKLLNLQTEDEIIFIPMAHIGYREYYADVADKVNLLSNSGYVLMYESIWTRHKDSIQRDHLLRKLRKVMRIQPTAFVNQVDTVNHRLFNGVISYPEDLDLISQPSPSELNIDTSKAVLADAALEDLINAYEIKHGRIQLSRCDLETGFNTEYNCPEDRRIRSLNFMNDFMVAYRDSALVNTYLSLDQPKVAIVYGAVHLKGFYKMLKKQDVHWVKVGD